MTIEWRNVGSAASKKYVCAYCGNSIASNVCYQGLENVREGTTVFARFHYLYICHFCEKPTYFNVEGTQTPGAPFGNDVAFLPSDVNSLYKESRRCYSAGAFTGSVLCSRKLLMNIAVSKGEAQGKTFAEYVDFLNSKGYIPPDGKEWVDKIRQKGNDATHEIPDMKKEDAEMLITFLEMLLRIIYEFPNRAKST